MLFDYNVYPDNSPGRFLEAVNKIMNCFPDIKEKEPLVDVDGSVIRTFEIDQKKIQIHDDYEVGAIYILSDVDLGHIFN